METMVEIINPATSYYKSRIEQLKVAISSQQLNIRRLHAQRNELNFKGK